MVVQSANLSHCSGVLELGSRALLYGKHYAVFSANADLPSGSWSVQPLDTSLERNEEQWPSYRSGAFTHSFKSIFNLKEMAIWRENSDCSIVTCHGDKQEATDNEP
jgi:hypothetical protein